MFFCVYVPTISHVIRMYVGLLEFMDFLMAEKTLTFIIINKYYCQRI